MVCASSIARRDRHRIGERIQGKYSARSRDDCVLAHTPQGIELARGGDGGIPFRPPRSCSQADGGQWKILEFPAVGYRFRRGLPIFAPPNGARRGYRAAEHL